MNCMRRFPKGVVTAPFSQQGGRRTASSAAYPSSLVTNLLRQQHSWSAFKQHRGLIAIGGVGIGLGTAQYLYGQADDFFEHKFTTTKDTASLATFYGSEDFMEVFCVFPFMVSFMMRSAEFDDEGQIHTFGLLGLKELKVCIDFDETEEEVDGTDTITWFNKRESFHDKAPAFLGGFPLWSMVQNFGYRMLDDGKTCEVYHHGESFSGFFPMRFLFQLHAKYVGWATEKFINSPEFGTEELEDEAEEIRQNIPFHEFNVFVEGLTRQVELAKKNTNNSDQKKQQELEATLRRLKTISSLDHSKTNPQLRTLKSHKTHISKVQLVIEDQPTNDTIKTAMKQISSSKGQRSQPAAAMRNLTRHTTIANQHKPSQE